MTQPQMTSTTSAHPTGDAEIVYYEGRPQFRADQLKVLMWGLIGIALIALPILNSVFDWGWPGWAVALSVVAGILAMILPVIVARTVRYRITNYRIDYERGILKRRIDTLELWHVDDISFEQGFVDRMLNVGSILIVSDDRSTPRLELHGIPEPRKIFDNLKQRVIAVKRQRGVIKVDSGQ